MSRTAFSICSSLSRRNGRLPAIIDHTNNDYVVWESAAILLYLAERFDPTGKFVGVSLEERSQVWQWLAFQVRIRKCRVGRLV